jgi:hypothetical protein
VVAYMYYMEPWHEYSKMGRFYTQLDSLCTSGYRRCHYRRSETRSLSHQTRLQTSGLGTNRWVKASEKRTSNCLGAGSEKHNSHTGLPFYHHAARMYAEWQLHFVILLHFYVNIKCITGFRDLNNTQMCVHRLKHYVSPFNLLDLLTCPYIVK